MKHKRLVAGVLSLALACTILSPLQLAFAEASESSADEVGSGSGSNSDENTRIDNQNLVTSKTAVVSDDDDGTYTITLEAYATGSKVITEVSKDIPADIILVLDQSGSMKSNSMYTYEIYNTNTTNYGYYYYTHDWRNRTLYYKTDDGAYVSVMINQGWSNWTYTYTYTYTIDGKSHTITTSTGDYTNPGITLYYKKPSMSRLQALKNAVTTFTDNVATKAAGATLGTDDDVNHRIAVVGFASGDKWNNEDYDYGNTEVLIGSNQYTYGSSAQSVYASAFQDMDTLEGKANVEASINVLQGDGGTLTNLGIEMANGIFESNRLESSEKRNRVVVVFTDGEPGWSGYDSSIAKKALDEIKLTKTKYGATVYTVGIFDGADATSVGDQDGTNTEKANWFMQNLSSNEGNIQTPSYYLSASTPEALNNIFQHISDQIETGGSSIELDSKAVVKDIISKYFTLPEGATENDIKVTSWDCSGVDSNDNYTWNNETETPLGVTATVENGQVSVTGFDFAENWVGTKKAADGTVTYRGKKLVISFKVKPRAGFLGGNDVPTNGAASGIYANNSADTALENFTQPTVNVPVVKPKFELNPKTIYKGNSTTVSGLYTIPTDYTWQDDYVYITSSVDGVQDGETVKPTNCTDYTVTVTYMPKYDGDKSNKTGGGPAGSAESEQGTATIHVLHPVVSAAVNDVQKYYGETYKLGDGANGTITLDWKDEHTEHTGIPPVEGVAPVTEDAYSLAYSVNETTGTSVAVPKADFDVDVKVMKGSDEIQDAQITTTCTYGCSPTSHKEGKYKVHVQTCRLTITKSNGASGEPYVFYIYKDDKYDEKYSEVTIVGTGSETIYELPVGSYTIQEDTGWSWRYTPAYDVNEAVLSADNPTGAITCTNTKSKNYWLNGYSDVVTNVSGKPHTAG